VRNFASIFDPRHLSFRNGAIYLKSKSNFFCYVTMVGLCMFSPNYVQFGQRNSIRQKSPPPCKRARRIC